MSFLTKPLESLAQWATQTNRKCVYNFKEGSMEDVSLLGHKGVSLCAMTSLNLPVPPGFIISTEASVEVAAAGGNFPENLVREYEKAIHDLERQTGLVFGPTDDSSPLLISIRSGSSIEHLHPEVHISTASDKFVSLPESWRLPGISRTVLNVGFNDKIAAHFTTKFGARFALDTYMRHLMSFGVIVMGADEKQYTNIIEECKASRGGFLTISDMQFIVQQFKIIQEVPADPWSQLFMAIRSVYIKWFSADSLKFRKAMEIHSNIGVAVCIQAMVYGNSIFRSGTGYCYSRNPNSGMPELFGEFVFNAEGDDVILDKRHLTFNMRELSERESVIYRELTNIMKKLEGHFRDMQEIEFTVDGGDVYVLQCKCGQRSAKASVKIAVDMVEESLLTQREAIMRLDAGKMNYFLLEDADPTAAGHHVLLGSGFSTCHGAITGKLAFNLADCEKFVSEGENAILCQHQITPADMHAVKLAAGCIVIGGDLTSEDAVLCRGMNKVCVTGMSKLKLQLGDTFSSLTCPDGAVLLRGDTISIDGASGGLFSGKLPTVSRAVDKDFQTILRWCDSYRNIQICGEISSFADVCGAISVGVDGVGSLSTDFLFKTNRDRLDLTRRILLAGNKKEFEKDVKTMLLLQKQDFTDIFRALPCKHISIKLLDTPVQEFLASSENDIISLALHLNMSVTDVRLKIAQNRNHQPTLGLRGARMAALHPELIELQVEAIISAALVLCSDNIPICPHLMISKVCALHELDFMIALIQRVANKVIEEYGGKDKFATAFTYEIGLMVDSPRGCLIAGELSPSVSQMNFDMLEIAQLTYGLSKEDSRKIMPAYLRDRKQYSDPFKTIDHRGFGAMIRYGINKARNINSSVRIGVVSGEHGGDVRTIAYCHHLGVDTISCPPHLVPVAKIGAAQAHIRQGTFLSRPSTSSVRMEEEDKDVFTPFDYSAPLFEIPNLPL